MDKTQIKNPRFELITSTLKGYKEVAVIFNYRGADNKYFIFIKENRNTNYISEAKKQFEEDVKKGEVSKSLKRSTSAKPYLIATAALGAVAITFAGLFIYKTIADQSKTQPNYLELPSKTTRISALVTEVGASITKSERTQVIKDKKVVAYAQTSEQDEQPTITEKGVTTYNDRGDVIFNFDITNSKDIGTIRIASHNEYKYNDKGLITWVREFIRQRRFGTSIVILNEKTFEYDNLNRLTKETHYTPDSSGKELKKTYEDIRTYKDNFATFVTRDLNDKEVIPGEEEITHIENTLDDEGYVISCYQKVTIDGVDTETYKYNTYDCNHCLIYEETYKDKEKIKDNLIGERYSTFHNSNPKKPISYYYWTTTSNDDTTTTSYTFSFRQFDQYGRTIDTITNARRVVIRDGSSYEQKQETKQHNEYDQLILA